MAKTIQIEMTTNKKLSKKSLTSITQTVVGNNNIVTGKNAEKLIPKGSFETVVIPAIKWLCENGHPHLSIIITPTGAELLEGIESTGVVFNYLVD